MSRFAFVIPILIAIALLLPRGGGAQGELPTPKGQLGGAVPIDTPIVSPRSPVGTVPPVPTEEPIVIYVAGTVAATTAPVPTVTPIVAADVSLAPVPASSPIAATQTARANPLAAAARSVVTVRATGGAGGIGSGIVVADGRHVVTAASVVDGAGAVDVETDAGQRRRASSIVTDQTTGLAVLGFDAGVAPPLTLAASTSLSAGSPVYAVGTAAGRLPGTIAGGVVSATDRYPPEGPPATLLIQHDAILPAGGDGGALLDQNGTVVGVVISLASGPDPGAADRATRGVTFAVPAAVASRVVEAVVQEGRLSYPYLGIAVEPAAGTPTPAARSVRVGEVVPGGPADQAGIVAGDVIVALDGVPLSAEAPFGVVLFAKAPGQRVDVSLLRGGQPTDVMVTLGERPTS